MDGQIDWDDAKAARNLEKHGVAFDEAQTVFCDPGALTIYDEEHSVTEDRFLPLGMSIAGTLLVLAYADDGESIRLISARRATRREAKRYAGTT